jgi:hypothetical protein
MMLRGYRDGDRELLTGWWLAGELLGTPVPGQPPLAEPSTADPPSGPDEEFCIAPGVAFVRYAELDWVHRRARVEIGVRPGHEDAVPALACAAVEHGLRELMLHRLYGWVTPSGRPDTRALLSAGFRREVSVPDGLWHAGGLVEREIWATIGGGEHVPD